jgi:hypothetical protein
LIIVYCSGEGVTLVSFFNSLVPRYLYEREYTGRIGSGRPNHEVFNTCIDQPPSLGLAGF